MKLILGLDPGVATGVALWDIDKQQFHSIYTAKLVEALIQIDLLHRHGELIRVVFEDARLRRWFGVASVERLQGAGSIKRDCQIVDDWCQEIGVPFKAVSPQAKGAKMDAGQFERLSGWSQRTSQHGRDAAMLCLGMRG